MPDGFVPNDPEGAYFYPSLCEESQVWQMGQGAKTHVGPLRSVLPRLHLRNRVSREERRSRRTVPVYIGRKACFFQKMTTGKWNDLKRGSDQEFAVNEAVTMAADPRLKGELNRFRGKDDLCNTLREMLSDAQRQVGELQERLVKERKELAQSMRRLEEADIYEELDRYYRLAFPTPIPPRHSPVITAMEPRAKGPVNSPSLWTNQEEGAKQAQHQVLQVQQVWAQEERMHGLQTAQGSVPHQDDPRSRTSLNQNREFTLWTVSH
jgi:hypothetical protein